MGENETKRGERKKATIKKEKKTGLLPSKTFREKQPRFRKARKRKGTPFSSRQNLESEKNGRKEEWRRTKERKNEREQTEAVAYLGLGLRADVHELDAGGEGAGEGLAEQGVEEMEARLSGVQVLAPLLHDPDAGLIDAEAEQGVPHGDRGAPERIERKQQRIGDGDDDDDDDDDDEEEENFRNCEWKRNGHVIPEIPRISLFCFL
jgi:hypothetical protein